MRKFVASLAAVSALASPASALAGRAATSVNGEFVELNVAVTPPLSGPARAPRGVGVALDSFSGNRINGDAPNNRTSIVVRFNRGFRENGALFPACQINPRGASMCADPTRIGAGTGEAQIVHPSGVQPNFLPAGLVAYNGRPYGGRGPDPDRHRSAQRQARRGARPDGHPAARRPVRTGPEPDPAPTHSSGSGRPSSCW